MLSVPLKEYFLKNAGCISASSHSVVYVLELKRCKRTPKSLDLAKTWANSPKIWAKKRPCFLTINPWSGNYLPRF